MLPVGICSQNGAAPGRTQRSQRETDSSGLVFRSAGLAARRKSDPQRVALARDLRRQTTVSLKWIAQRLEMGSWTHVSNLLSATRLE
jgi:hypothetical protein